MTSVNLDSLVSLIANLAIVMMMVLEMLLVMTTLANVLARPMLLEISVISALQDILDSHLAKVTKTFY